MTDGFSLVVRRTNGDQLIFRCLHFAILAFKIFLFAIKFVIKGKGDPHA